MIYQFSGTASIKGRHADQADKLTFRQTPAPDAYSLSFYNKKNAPCLTIQPASEETEQLSQHKRSKNVAPEPGTYNIKSKIGSGTKYSFGSGYKEASGHKASLSDSQKYSAMLGPDKYNPEDKLIKRKLPQYSFSYNIKSENQVIKQDIPGPGTYPIEEDWDIHHNKQEIQSSDRSSQKKFRNTLNTFGQTSGSGWSCFVTKKAKKNGFGSDKRLKLYCDNQIPGPGFYSPSYSQEEIKISKSIAKATKVPKMSFEFTPAPDRYVIKNSSLSRRSTFSKKLNSILNKQNEDMPGPDQYRPIYNQIISSKNTIIGTDSRKPLLSSWEKFPGPGQYNPEKFKMGEPHSYSMGTDVRKPLNGNIISPGPGSYKLDNQFHGPRYTTQGRPNARLEQINDQNIPGPNNYNPLQTFTQFNSPQFSLGSDRRFQKIKNETLSCRMYDVRGNPLKMMGPKYSFGKRITTKFPVGSILQPGPGSYNLPTSILNMPPYLQKKNQSDIKNINKLSNYLEIIRQSNKSTQQE